MIIFYHLFLLVYKAGIHVVSLGNRKAKLWISGRKNVFENLRTTVSVFNNEKIIWMHCASLGEFEQGRPVLEKIKEQQSNVQIIISFFSPSGFEIV
ncbi:MAG TPA: glycosyltransferase N-terminal domain-containing protein, partial [Hanamia sp.]|nr:glycosyltransferase N-terminal domain-containing protein [Hanamia sp.]